MPSSSKNILKAIRQLINENTLENANQLASLAGLTLEDPNKKIEAIEHTTKKGKVIRGVVRTDLSYSEAKAIDEFTFKKNGGWFIREKHFGQGQESKPVTAQSEPIASVKSDVLVSDQDNGIDALKVKFKPASSQYKTASIRFDPKDGAKLLKKTLTKLFPDTKFSVVMGRGTGYGSVDVSWIDGASIDLVSVVTNHFQGKGFSSIDDSTIYKNSVNEAGEVVDYGLGYVSYRRTYSKGFLERFLKNIPENLKRWVVQYGVGVDGSDSDAYFTKINEYWAKKELYDALQATSTGKYNFGVVPQADDDDFELSSQSESERLAKDAKIKLLEQQKRDQEEKARLKAQADKELNDFRLTGSSLPSDVAASYGQGDMFVSTRGQKLGENNVPSTSNALESDIKPTSTPDSQQGIKNSNDDESGELGRLARPPVNGLDARGGSERDSSISLSENDGIGVGARGDTSVSDGAGERGVGASDTTTKSSRSSSTNEPRTPIKRERDRAVVRTATTTGSVTQTAKEAEQLKAEGTPTQWGDAQNIDKALPYLLPEQRDDVAKLEKRLIEENKNGMLFTNGTGTGKTFTGLGAVKRFANAGKKNILIVSMNDKIVRDFVKSAKSLNLDIHQLDGIIDNGKDKIVATTYANLAQNNTLGLRDWDLIVVDEAHNLMQGEKGEDTNALAKLRALSGHHAGFSEWVKMRHADKDPKPIGESPETGLPIYNQDEVAAWEAFKKPLREQWQKTWAEQPKGRTKVIFLTATPFSYVKTLDWAEGYLFDFVPPAEKFSNKTDTMGLAYNSGSAQERFYMSNFGYKMRYNRLTRPNSKVDVGILERKFAEKLKTEGAMSGRDLSVPFDYDRKFVLIDSKIGEKIDEGFKFLRDAKNKDGKSKYSDLLRAINRRFDYLSRLQLLEAIKAEEAVDQIKKHLALGRKVIVFHDYNVGGSTNPFVFNNGFSGDAEAVESQYNEFKRERPDLINLKLNIPAPIVTLRKAFPTALMFNGTVSKGQRNKNADLFNSDDSGLNVMIAQSDAAATGISFHDTTGKHQRVIINIGMPTKPAKLRQTEGRIYRVGQASNAIQRYLTTGTGWERSAFAQKIAERAETVDNLAQGESAVVSIKDALVRAYEEAEYFEPSENDGIGGKAYDEENNRVMALSPFERAKTDYWVKQKVTAKRSEREGKEWYATPEPVGLFMVNLAGAHSGDDILEPSAGDGAIGRYMPSDASVTMVEPSESLASRARMNNTNANVVVDTFENHGTNNKYDAIVMNPPFGQGGAIAIKHLVKAFGHLRDGGRVVALLPVGKMDELIAKYQADGYFKDIYTVAEFTLPSSTFENAGTRVNTKIHVFEKHENEADAPQGIIRKDLSHYDDISGLFDAIENISIKPRKPRLDEALAQYGIEVYPDRSKYVVSGEGLKRIDITATLFTPYDKPNADGDYVEKYNRSSAYLKWLKEGKIPTMAQFNQGLSANNLPIKYQDLRSGFKHNVWDGFGEKPYWLEQSMRYGAKLEDFAVEKPVYDAVSDNDPKAILAAMRQALDVPSDENIKALARAAGLKIVKPLSAPVAPVITQSTDETSETFGEQANKDIAQPQANTSGLFGDTDTFENKDVVSEYEIFAKYKNAIAMDIVKEIRRVENLMKVARSKGKYSSAEHNRKKIAQKWGVNPVGWGTFDKMFGYALEVTIRGAFSGKSVKYTDQDIHDGAIKFINEWLAAVEKPVYDAISDTDPKAILAAMRQALDVPSDENIKALARAAGLKIVKPLPTKVIFNGLDLSDPETYKDEKIAKIAKLVGKTPQLLPSGMGYSAFRAAILAGKYPQLVFDALEKDRIENEKISKKTSAKESAAKAALPMLLGMALPSGYSLSQEGDLIVLRGKFNDAINTVVKSAGGSWNGVSKDNLKLWEIPNDGSAILYRGISKLVTTQPIVDPARPLSDDEKAAQLDNELAIKSKAMAIQGVGFYAGLTVTAGDKRYIVDFKYDEHLVAKIKAIDGSKYNPNTKTWLVPFEQAEQLKLIVDDVKQKAIDKTQQEAKQLAEEKAQGIIRTYDLLYAYPTKSALGTQRTIKGVVYDVIEASRPVKVDSSDVSSLGGEIGGDRDAWMVYLKLKPRVSAKYDDIGSFNFTPAIDFDQTLKAIKETLANGSHDNIKRLATLAGLTLKEPEPDIDLDMFGEPLNQDFDLFGDPIQDGDDSPVEELPRLAVVELPLNKLTLSEDVPQFKSGADGESGVVEALGGKFDRTGVAPIQVWERTDGRLEIISGRHRTDLARRSGEKTIPAQVHKESEGFTAKQAMMLDAELNIRDGQGKVKDYVDYFTHSEISEDEAERRGLIARSIGQRAFTIASKGSEELKTLHRNEIISDQAAAEIANIAPSNSAMQAVGLRVLQEHKPLNNALNTIRAVMALTREKGQEPDTFDLFGFDDSAMKEAEAMARIASRKQRQIAEQLTAIKGAVKNPKLAAKHGVIVENEADALAKVQAMTAQKARWDNWSSHADLLAEVREELNDKFDSLLDDDDDYYWLCQEELAL